MPLLALDVGDKRIGIARSDPLGLIATPIMVLDRKNAQRDANEIVRIAGEQGADTILVGMPYSMDGSTGTQAQRVQRFIDALSALTELPVLAWDERLSTVEAERRMRETGVPSVKRRQRIDAVAAAVILQSYLDRSSD